MLRFIKRIMNNQDTYYVQRDERSGVDVIVDSDGHIVGEYEDYKDALEEAQGGQDNV